MTQLLFYSLASRPVAVDVLESGDIHSLHDDRHSFPLHAGMCIEYSDSKPLPSGESEPAALVTCNEIISRRQTATTATRILSACL